MALTAAEIAELNRLGTQELRKLRESLMQDVQDLYSQWSELSSQQDPELDPEIMKIFGQLDLRENLLPEIEKILDTRARKLVRAA